MAENRVEEFCAAKAKYISELYDMITQEDIDPFFLPCLAAFNRCTLVCSTQCCSGHDGTELYFSFITMLDRHSALEALKELEKAYPQYELSFQVSFDGHYAERYTVWGLPAEQAHYEKLASLLVIQAEELPERSSVG